MSDHGNRGQDEFERRLQAVLRESVDRLDGATRSKLTQARHAALEQAPAQRAAAGEAVFAGAGGGGSGPRTLLLPAAAAIAAAAVLAVLLATGRGLQGGAEDGGAAVFQDIDLLADHDAYGLLQEDDAGFVEWAATAGSGATEATDAAGEGR